MSSPFADNIRSSIKDRSGQWRQRFAGSRRVRNRLVQKSGLANISLVNMPKQGRKFFSDFFTTIVDVKWRWCMAVFVLTFLLSWTVFSLVYLVVMLAHGDFAHSADADWTPCIGNIRSFASVFMFSLETQSTIGYGFRYPTEMCPVVLVTVCVQSMMGVMLQTLTTGVVFAKLARPKKRAQTLLFSKNCVVCMRDGLLCLCLRVGDMRRSQLAEAHVRLQMIKKRITSEGELLPFHQFDMDVGFDTGNDRIFVIWPITICHVIDEDSPMYEMSKEDLSEARFEIIAILEGVVESTGSTTQARTSYLPSEVIWGHRFEKLVTYQRHNGDYRIDFGKFDATIESPTPEYSAQQLDEMREAGLKPESAYRCRRWEEVENQGQTPYGTIHAPDASRPTVMAHLNVDELRRAVSSLNSDESDDESPPPPTTSTQLSVASPQIVVHSASGSSIGKPCSPDKREVAKSKRSVLREHDLM